MLLVGSGIDWGCSQNRPSIVYNLSPKTNVIGSLLLGSTSNLISANQRHREALGFWRRDGAGRIKLPCYDAFNELLAQIDPAELSRVLNEWLAANQGTLPRSLALDGKAVGSLTAASSRSATRTAGRRRPWVCITGRRMTVRCPDILSISSVTAFLFHHYC